MEWEVFEVHRASEAPRGVSPGLERGWLAFSSLAGKRRLAPFPDNWESYAAAELEGLCDRARRANPPRYPEDGPRVLRKRIEEPPEPEEAPEDRNVREVVRTFAREARAAQSPAIGAMVRLKALLAERFNGSDTPPEVKKVAGDMRRVRRWFVEAYYFERSS
ncbi:MAG: hypothetical protein V4550_13740 [Gemmatimonadota bacterium]